MFAAGVLDSSPIVLFEFIKCELNGFSGWMNVSIRNCLARMPSNSLDCKRIRTGFTKRGQSRVVEGMQYKLRRESVILLLALPFLWRTADPRMHYLHVFGVRKRRGPGSPQQQLKSIMDKLAALAEILQLDPTNTFARYGIAMEHLSQGNQEAALAEFDTLIASSPDYVPAYQISAQTLHSLGRKEATLARLDEGIAAALRTQNPHAVAEMSALRDELTGR